MNLRDFAARLFRPVEDHGPSEGHLALDGPHSLPAPGTSPTPWIDENNIVTFETGTQYADATNITIWANWAPAGGWLRIPMEKQADGRWRLAVGPLEGGSYYYKFVVDRVDHKDTSNPTTVTSEPGGSGVATTEYRIDGGDWTSYDGPVLVNGDHPPREVVFEYRSIDANGNVEATKALPFTPVGKHHD